MTSTKLLLSILSPKTTSNTMSSLFRFGTKSKHFIKPFSSLQSRIIPHASLNSLQEPQNSISSFYLDNSTYLQTKQHITQAKTLLPETYTSNQFARLEHEKVFKKTWVAIGSSLVLNQEGSEETFSFGNQEIRIKNNKGKLEADKINVKKWGSVLFVNFDPDLNESEKLWKYQMGDLDERYGHYPWDNMKIALSKHYNISANWKLVVENFCESYHVAWVHPELFQITNVGLYVENQGIGQYMGVVQSDLTKGRKLFDDDSVFFNDLRKIDYERGWFIHIFPNVAYFMFPHHIVVLTMFPDKNNPNKSTEIMNLLVKSDFDDKKNEKELNELMRFYNMINGEDIRACELCQQGMQCDVFDGGMFSGKFEKGLHRFQNILIDYMTNDYMKQYSSHYPN